MNVHFFKFLLAVTDVEACFADPEKTTCDKNVRF